MSTDGWYPQAVRLPITTNEYYKTRAVPLTAIVEHITDGNDSRDYLQHANNQSSVHFLVREENRKGIVYQFMPVHWAAWGNGRHSGKGNPYMPDWVKALIDRGININHATVSIEHERKWLFTTPLSGVMLEASIGLHKWLAGEYPMIIADRDHDIGHYQIDHVDRANCPGGPRGGLFPFTTMVEALRGSSMPPPSSPDDALEFPGLTPYKLRTGFKDLWLKHGLDVCGYPLTDEFVVPEPRLGGRPVTYQLCQNVLFQWYDGIEPRIADAGTVIQLLAQRQGITIQEALV